MVILVHVGSASASNIQFAMQREAQFGKVWFPASGNLPNERHAAKAARVLFRETGAPCSSDDLQLVRGEVVSITPSDSSKRHVSVLSASAPSQFNASH
jgi:hypothetical protein